ncbi:MAG TPA: site-specific integrase [Candidatus Kapabacteria bacterium]|nr:site-specific integrase [Candidatus Kapabacteria bacterium]
MTFCLRNAAAKQETAIAGYVHWTTAAGYHQWKLATGLRVHPEQWNQKRRRPKRGVIGESLINTRLGEIETRVQRIFVELEVAGLECTPAAVRERYQVAAGRKAPTKAPDFFDIYEQFIDNNATFSAGTRKIHHSALRALRAFAKTSNVSLTFDRLDVVMWERFIRHLITVRKITNVSAWAIAKSIKAFVAAAYDQGLHGNETHRRVTRGRLLPQTESSDQEYLTPEELARVEAHDMNGEARLLRVRDLFTFLAHTGLRYSDSQQIEPYHRDGDTLKFTTGKNRKTVAVPLDKVARQILDRYEGRLPRISNQKANTYLAEVLAAAKIEQPVQIVRFRGTERVERTERKCDVVGMHGAKRTYITLSLLRGVSLEALAKVTGNTPATLRVYDVRTSQDAIQEIRETWEG